MSSNWSRRRKEAREAGALDAEMGEDRSENYRNKGPDLMESYVAGRSARLRELEQRQEAFDHPLRQISRDANALWSRSDVGDVAELSRLIEALADYLVEKEES